MELREVGNLSLLASLLLPRGYGPGPASPLPPGTDWSQPQAVLHRQEPAGGPAGRPVRHCGWAGLEDRPLRQQSPRVCSGLPGLHCRGPAPVLAAALRSLFCLGATPGSPPSPPAALTSTAVSSDAGKDLLGVTGCICMGTAGRAWVAGELTRPWCRLHGYWTG